MKIPQMQAAEVDLSNHDLNSMNHFANVEIISDKEFE